MSACAQSLHSVEGNDTQVCFLYLSKRSDTQVCFLHVVCMSACAQSLRSVEGNDAQVCFFIVQMLLLRNKEFSTRVQEFVREVGFLPSAR